MAPLRPIIQISSTIPSERIVNAFAEKLRQTDLPVRGIAAPSRLEFYVPTERVHFWSPQLTIELSDHDTGCDLVGRFGPHPNIWTIFVAGYAFSTFLCVISMSFAYAQWVMEEVPIAISGVFLGIFSGMILYVLGTLGRKRGKNQMRELEVFVRKELTELEDRI